MGIEKDKQKKKKKHTVDPAFLDSVTVGFQTY